MAAMNTNLPQFVEDLSLKFNPNIYFFGVHSLLLFHFNFHARKIIRLCSAVVDLNFKNALEIIIK